jgi:hypothetical protein
MGVPAPKPNRPTAKQKLTNDANAPSLVPKPANSLTVIYNPPRFLMPFLPNFCVTVQPLQSGGGFGIPRRACNSMVALSHGRG